MKTKNFTLVELLVVIGIIILLAGLLLPAVASGLKKADITKCKAQMTTLANAIKQYQATYGRLPIPKYESATDNNGEANYKIKDEKYNKEGDNKTFKTYTEGNAFDSAQYAWLIKVLQAHELTTNEKKANPKEIKFLDIVDNTPCVYQDPWDQNFNVFLDTGYDGKITASVSGLIGSPFYYSVIIYSNGPDGVTHESTVGDEKNEDNVYSVNTKWKSGTGHQITK